MSSFEKLQEKVLRFIYNNYTTPYVDLLRKACIPSVWTAWQWSAVIEVIEWSITQVMQSMFTLNKNNHNLCSDNNILLPKCHTTKFGLKSFAYQAGSLWNKLPNIFRTCESLKDVKTKIVTWSIDMWYIHFTLHFSIFSICWFNLF